MMTVFNDLKTKDLGLSERDICFSFKYPLVLGYNNDSTIQINNFEGLLSAIANQNRNFYLTGLQFPVQVAYQNKDVLSVIEKEEDFITVLKECQIPTFRNEIDTLFKQCFKFSYPVLLKDKNNKDTIVDNENSFDRFLQDNGNEYQPDFKFPVEVLVAPKFTATKVSSYYEFYEIINNCIGCPDTKFQIESLANNRYRFVLNFEVKDGYRLFFIINEKIHGEIIDGNPFEKLLAPGDYDICIKAITPDCLNGKEFCKKLKVEPACPEIIIDYEEISPQHTTYRFTPRVTMLNEDVTVSWYLNNTFVKDELLSVGYVDIELDQGTNTVCADLKTENCPDGVRSCAEVILR